MKLLSAYLLLFILITSCEYGSSEKINQFGKFLEAEQIKIKSPSLVLVLPNDSCSFCVNEILNFLNTRSKESQNMVVIFLESEILTMIDKEILKEVASKIEVVNVNVLKAKNYSFLSEHDVEHYLPLAIEYTDEPKIHEIPPDVDYKEIFDLINSYY